MSSVLSSLLADLLLLTHSRAGFIGRATSANAAGALEILISAARAASGEVVVRDHGPEPRTVTMAGDFGSTRLLLPQTCVEELWRQHLGPEVELLGARTAVGMVRAGRLVGAIGLAGRPAGYDPELARSVVPATLACELVLRELRGELQDRLAQTKEEFVGIVSHELRTPLSILHAALGLIAAGAVGELPSTVKPVLDMAVRNSRRLTSLVNELVDMERLVSRRMELHLERCDVLDLVIRSMEEAAARTEHYGVEIYLESSDVSAIISVDGERLIQAVLHLLDNATKFSRRGDRVVVRVERHGLDVLITVEDHGPGIAPELLDKIFDKFFQADSSTTRDAGGVGLGLTLCRDLIEHMGGRVEVTSEVGTGSRFTIRLPMVHGDETVHPEQETREPQ